MKIIVTGGCGMIGGPLVKHLVDMGHKVIVIDDLSRGRLENIAPCMGDENFLGVVTWPVQVDRAWEDALQALEGTADRIYHLAARIGGVGKMYAEPFGQAVNAVSDYFAIFYAVKWGAELLYTSTACVYPTFLQTEDDRDRDLRETDVYPAEPESLYGLGKLYGEGMVKAACQQLGLRGTIVRMFNAVGPEFCDIEERHVIPALLGKLLNGDGPLEVWGNGKAERSFLDARDAARAIDLVMEEGENGEAYNVGEEKRYTVADIAQRCINWVDPTTSIMYNTSKPEGIASRCPSMDKIRQLGFEVQYSLDEMIEYVHAGLIHGR